MKDDVRATKAIAEQRVNELIPLVSCLHRKDILNYARKQGWTISNRQIDEYISKARNILKEEFNNFKNNAIESIYNNYLQLYKKAFKKDDLNTCRLIMSDIAKIMGLNNLDITSKGEKIMGFSVVIEDEKILKGEKNV